MATDTVLVVDDEIDLVHGLQRTIAMEIDCRVLTAENGREALDTLSKTAVDVVLADILMPEMDGMALLESIKRRDPTVTVIIMTAYGTIEKAVEAIKKGAYDLIQQLENLIRGWYAMIPDAAITLEHLYTHALPKDQRIRTVDQRKPYQELKEAAIEAFTRQYLNRLLRSTGGNLSAAALASRMKRQSLQKIIKRYGIDVQRLRP